MPQRGQRPLPAAPARRRAEPATGKARAARGRAAALRTLPAGRTDVRSYSGPARCPVAQVSTRTSLGGGTVRPRTQASPSGPSYQRAPPPAVLAGPQPVHGPHPQHGPGGGARGRVGASSRLCPTAWLCPSQGQRAGPRARPPGPAGPLGGAPSGAKPGGVRPLRRAWALPQGNTGYTASRRARVASREGGTRPGPGTRSAGAPPCVHTSRGHSALRGGPFGEGVLAGSLCQDLQTSYRSRDGAPAEAPASSHGDEDAEEWGVGTPYPARPVCSHLPAPPTSALGTRTLPAQASSQEAAGHTAPSAPTCR